MLNLLQSQLSFFGAIDEAVLFAKDGHGENPEKVLRIVGILLPGTTGFGQAGWYHELLDFANRPKVRNRRLRGPVTFPSVEQSLEYLQASTAQERMRLATAALPPGPTPQPTPQPRTDPPSPPPEGGNEPPADPSRTPAALPERVADSGYTSYHDPVLARAAYAAMVLARIADLGGLPPRLSAIPDLPARIMLAAVGSWAVGTALTGSTLEQTVQDLLDEAKVVESRDQWRSFAAMKVNQLFANQSLPCFGTLELFGDQY
ncbi:MAG: hypothetical protein WAN02_13940, partial [Mycobacterium sp.]